MSPGSPDGTPRDASRTRLADQVLSALMDTIRVGDAAADSMLPPERRLADDLNVDRTSLRQAIARLEQMGLVEPQQGRGTVVRDSATVTDPMWMAHLADHDSANILTELFEVREALAGLIARLATERGDGAGVQLLRATLGEVARSTNAPSCQAHELAFFGHLVKMTHNRPLLAMQGWVDQSYGKAAEYFVNAFENSDEVLRGLTPIVDAIESGDGESASVLCAGYAASSAARMLTAAASIKLDDDPSSPPIGTR